MAKRFRITRGNDTHQSFKKPVEKDPGDDFEPEDAEEPEDEIPAEFDPKKRKVEPKVESKKIVEPVVRRVVVPPPPTRKVAPVPSPKGEENLQDEVDALSEQLAKNHAKLAGMQLAFPEVVEVAKVDFAEAEKKVVVHQTDLLDKLFQRLSVGDTLILTALDVSTWSIMAVNGNAKLSESIPGVVHTFENGKDVTELVESKPAKVAKPSKSDGKTLNPEYVKWEQEWKALSFEQKCAKAKKAGVKWDKHANQMRENINLTMAYRKHLGIEKYL